MIQIAITIVAAYIVFCAACLVLGLLTAGLSVGITAFLRAPVVVVQDTWAFIKTAWRNYQAFIEKGNR